MTSVKENRAKVRIRSRFWVAVEGVDEFPHVREGNISSTGVYFQTNQSVGPVGSMQWLYLAASERQEPVEIMARVVRTLSLEALGRGSVFAGVALELLPQDQPTRAALAAIVQELAEHQLDEEATEAAGTGPAVQRIRLETRWSVNPGEVMQVMLQAPGSPRAELFEARVLSAAPLKDHEPPLNRVELQVTASMEAPYAASSAEAVHLIFSDESTQETVEETGRHLIGSLSRIPLTSLLSFAGLEHLTGLLELTSEECHASLYLGQGRLLEVEVSPPAASPREALLEVLTWTDGHFEFHAQPINRPDQFNASMAALLLDLTRVLDERKASRQQS